jgi:hypothetical protein
LADLYGSELLDFRCQDKREKVFDYTINTNHTIERTNPIDEIEEGLERFTKAFNSKKTLYSEISTVVVEKHKLMRVFDCAILLKTRVASIRENFDELLYREI